MKILHIVPSYKPAYIYGGTIESVARLCEALVNAGEEVKVFTTNANGKQQLNVEPNKEYVVDGVQVIYFKKIFKDPYYISPALWRRLYRQAADYDVVHIHSWWNMLVAVSALICKLKRVKIVLSPHGMFSDYILQHSNTLFKKFMHVGLGKSLLKASVFHATSDAEFAECEKFIRGWKGFMIPNIVWLPQLTVSKQENEQFTIIYLSRIHPKKGIELLMEAISRLSIKPVLQIAGTGDGNYVNTLKEKAKQLNITENIKWVGWQDRKQKFTTLMQADLFALTSYNENFGNVVIEALYAGTPVLISDNVGLSGFVNDHHLGWVCKTDVDDIEIKLSEAIANTAMRKRINKCSSLSIENYLSEKKLIALYISHYKN